MSSSSVIIPTRNRSEMVAEAVASAQAASPPPEEIIVVDAGSSDETQEQLDRLGVNVIHLRPTKPAAARNAGARAASSDYLAFLDSDDRMLPNRLACLEPILDASPNVGMAIGRTRAIDTTGQPHHEATRRHLAGYRKAERLGTSYAALARHCLMFTSATLTRREAFEAVGGYDEDLTSYEDWDLYLRLALSSRLTYANCTVAEYRVWPGNVRWDLTARGVAEVAEKHLVDPTIPSEAKRAARFAFLERLCAARHTLLEQKEARRVALSALRLTPLALVTSRRVASALIGSYLPHRVLALRRGRRVG